MRTTDPGNGWSVVGRRPDIVRRRRRPDPAHRRWLGAALSAAAFLLGSRAPVPALAQPPAGPVASTAGEQAVAPAKATRPELDAVERGIWENVFDGGNMMPAPPAGQSPRPLLPSLSRIADRDADDLINRSGDPASDSVSLEDGEAPIATAEELNEIPFLIPPEHDMPLGWVGPRMTLPGDYVVPGDLFPVADRWRLGFPYWYRYAYGSPLDPYHQNVLKGDYPFEIGGNQFIELTGVSETQVQTRNKLVNLTGTDQDYQFRQRFFFTTDYFINDNTFHPSEWFVRMTHALEYRSQTDFDEFVDYAFQELFLDVQLGIVSPWYDTTDLRVGRQVFASDFRGFLYNDVNNMVRLFGNRDANRLQWNVILIDAVQQDQVSQFLRTEADRDQIVAGANVFRQDWPVLGVTVHAGAFFNRDRFVQDVDSYFFEVAAEGVYRGFEFTAAFIQALGRDEANPIAQRAVDVNAQFAAFELARPMDFIIPRASVLWASGDDDPTDGTGRGFDAIFDNPAFAGANFAYFNREQLNARNLRLSNFNSFLPNLRTKAFQPVNFVNPGILVLTAGIDSVLSARTVAFLNYNYYEFDAPEAVEQGVRVKNAGQNLDVSREIGSDITLGVVYKPLIVDNALLTVGASRFFSGDGIETLGADNDPELYVTFAALTLVY